MRWPGGHRPPLEIHMSEIRFTIDDEIFQRFPGYLRGVVVAHGVRNAPSPEGLITSLREAEASVRERLSIETLTDEPRLKAWREAYRAFGAKPSEFRASIEALVRRVLHGNSLPTINALVDIGTMVSLNHVAPAGGHAIDVLRHDIALRFATGEEEFMAFGSEAKEQPLPGEVIFVEGNTVLTRRWTWRQAAHTSIQLDTEAIEFNVDGLPPVGAAEVEQGCREIAELIERYCSGTTRYELLTKSHPSITLTTLAD